MFANNTVIKCPDVTIPNGTADSNIITRDIIGDAVSITLYAPSSLDAHTYVIQVSEKPNATSSDTFVTWNNSAADIGPPAASKATVYDFSDFGSFKIHDSTGTVAAARTWHMTKKA